MELSSIQIIATVFASLIILKIFIMLIMPTSTFKKFISIYDNLNLDMIYYIYIGTGSFLFYYIYQSSSFNLSDILAIIFPTSFIIGGAMVKMLDNDGLSKIMRKYDTFGAMFKSMWLYLLVWISLSILTLKEIFFN